MCHALMSNRNFLTIDYNIMQQQRSQLTKFSINWSVGPMTTEAKELHALV